jgi:hypothetical protein
MSFEDFNVMYRGTDNPVSRKDLEEYFLAMYNPIDPQRGGDRRVTYVLGDGTVQATFFPYNTTVTVIEAGERSLADRLSGESSPFDWQSSD